MTDQIRPLAPWSIKDMQIATGFSRPTVIKYIDQGALPGYRMPNGGKYVIPALWALAWMRGEWRPETKDTEYISPVTLIHHRAA